MSIKLSKPQMLRLYKEADAAGEMAATEVVPPVMEVIQPDDPVASLMGKPTGGRVIDRIPDGPCGFAWINVKPGTSRFARWLKENIDAAGSDDYLGGVTIWVRGYRQSYVRKDAYARAFAGVLREAGINANAGGRLD